MMKKGIVILLVGFLLICCCSAEASQNHDESLACPTRSEPQSTATHGDELDQSQTICTSFAWVGHIYLAYEWNNITLAQSFIPQKDVLTRVEMLIGKNWSAAHPLTLSIRSSLDGDALATTSVDPVEMVSYPNMSWIEFDIPDILVTPGTSYYLVLNTTNVTDSWYWIGATSNQYPNGTCYLYGYIINEWQDMYGDICFRTYGQDSSSAVDVSFKPGLGVTVVCTNTGMVTLTNLNYTITVTGGIFGLINKPSEGLLPKLSPGEGEALTVYPLGFGRIIVSVTIVDTTVHAQGLLVLCVVVHIMEL
ncbi:MAG: hypothetical protein JXA00_01235 [Candidatus Thermoplasmatota archaeon]|nr:hypothetical protein [Candidatus Thermoplasmatota archaeon]